MTVETVAGVIIARADVRDDVAARDVRALRSTAAVIAPRGLRVDVRVAVRLRLFRLRDDVVRVVVCAVVSVRDIEFVPRTAATATPVKSVQKITKIVSLFISDI